MRIVIQQNQCGYLVKNGIFQRLLRAGSYFFPKLLGYDVLIVPMEGEVQRKRIPMEVLLRDEEFAKSVVRIQIPDDSIAVHYVNGMYSGILLEGEHDYWNVFEQHTFRLLDIDEPQVADDIPRYLFPLIPGRLYHKVEVGTGETALVYFDNRLQGMLESGTYYYWTHKTQVTHKIFDLKAQQLEINGQEILTADKAGVRLNLLCTYRITDPEAMAEHLSQPAAQIYSFVQLTVREYVGRYRLDELLSQKEEIAGQILALLRGRETEFFVEFKDAGIKDIILPGDLREMMNAVLLAEKTAQANTIARREEVASTRSLLNTARLMEENKTLYKLKELEYVEKICERVDSISLAGAGGVLGQLEKLILER